MSRYAGVAVVALLVCVLTGATEAAGYAAGVVLAVGVVLHAGYAISVRRGLRPVPLHRPPLDRLVVLQWLGVSVIGAILTTIGLIWDPTVVNPPRFVAAAILAATIAVVAVFCSSLIDWYWILPRVGGIVRRAPCEEAGGQKWARVTGVWLIHRAVATLLVTGGLAVVFIYMGDTAKGTERTLWFVIAGVVAAATLAFNQAALRALWQAFNPQLHVGALLSIHGRTCYIVDVSLQGAKYKVVDDLPHRTNASGNTTPEDPPPSRPFLEKKDDSFPLEDFARHSPIAGATPPCATGCQAINWYCRHNSKAYD